MTIDTLHPLSNATVNVTVEVRLAGRSGAGVLAPDRAHAVADLLDAAIDRAAALAIEAGDPA